ncbi:MAG: 2-hydroxyacid dehydrogenase [Solirubrobacterales bacterium]
MADVSGPRPTVLIALRLLPAGRDRLEAHCEIREGGLDATPERLRELAPGVDAIVSDPTVTVDEELLEAAGPQLRIVANFAVGYDSIDLEACRRRGIAVTNTPDVLTNGTAELALALTLAAARRMSEAERDLRAGRWTGWDPGAYLGTELSGAAFGVVGLGRIGRRYAGLVRPLAGEILYVARRAKPEAERELGAIRVDLEEALERSDTLSLHVPANEETARLIGAAELASMKSTAVIVNTARGPILDEGALAEALREGSIGAAGLDVYESEPKVHEDLLAAPRCVLLPHIGSATTRARDGMASLVADNVLAALDGAEPPNRVA